ncbi:hypothetical protein IW262DRAFT_1299786 [Armillaria fumosa]|nr:hypothetical protein IW262DRAFT_1299786 [Armillaria fumosa]
MPIQYVKLLATYPYSFRETAAATGVAPDALRPSDTQAATGEDTLNYNYNTLSMITHYWPDGDDSKSEGSDNYEGVYNKQQVHHAPATEGHSSESLSNMNEDETHNEDTLSTGDVDVPAMRAGAPNQDLTQVTANQAALAVFMGHLFSSHDPHGHLSRYKQQLGHDELEHQGGVGGLAMGMCDIINVYISMQGADGLEHPHMEYDVSVSRASIGEALTHILAHGGQAVQVLKEMDHSPFTESPHFNTPLHHSRACPETLMVAEETQLSREDIYVIYIYRTSPGDYSLPQPTAAGAPTAPSAPATAPRTDEMPEWATWDRLFLESIKPMACLFDKSYNEAFKVYTAVSTVMGITHEINTADKKHMGMGKDG